MPLEPVWKPLDGCLIDSKIKEEQETTSAEFYRPTKRNNRLPSTSTTKGIQRKDEQDEKRGNRN